MAQICAEGPRSGWGEGVGGGGGGGGGLRRGSTDHRASLCRQLVRRTATTTRQLVVVTSLPASVDDSADDLTAEGISRAYIDRQEREPPTNWTKYGDAQSSLDERRSCLALRMALDMAYLGECH